MKQDAMKLLGPLEWEDSAFWGMTSKCRRFSIRSQTVNGKTEHVLWRRGRDGTVIPINLGTFDTFTTYGGPANLLETANTVGLPLYARQMMDAKGRWIDLMTEASILPVNKRPRLAIRIFSSN
jgi:hypothetical protein